MITKTAQKLEELGYIDSWKGKLQAAKDTTAKYIAGNAAANALSGAAMGIGGELLSAMAPKGGRANLKARLALAFKNSLRTAPATAAAGAAIGVAEAPVEYAYTKGFVPSKDPIKSMFGYVQVPEEINKKYVKN